MSGDTGGRDRETTDPLAKSLKCSTGKARLHDQYGLTLERFRLDQIPRSKTSNLLVRIQENRHRSFGQRGMLSEIPGQGEYERQSAAHVNGTGAEQLALLDSGGPALAFSQTPHRIQMAQNQNGFLVLNGGTPAGEN